MNRYDVKREIVLMLGKMGIPTKGEPRELVNRCDVFIDEMLDRIFSEAVDYGFPRPMARHSVCRKCLGQYMIGTAHDCQPREERAERYARFHLWAYDDEGNVTYWDGEAWFYRGKGDFCAKPEYFANHDEALAKARELTRKRRADSWAAPMVRVGGGVLT